MSDESDARPQPPSLEKRVETEDLEAAGGWSCSSSEDSQQRRLARSVLAEHGQVLAAVDHQVDRLERHLCAETLGQPGGDDCAHSAAPSGASSGVLISGQSTNGPQAKSSRVATISVMTHLRGWASWRPPAPPPRAVRRPSR